MTWFSTHASATWHHAESVSEHAVAATCGHVFAHDVIAHDADQAPGKSACAICSSKVATYRRGKLTRLRAEKIQEARDTLAAGDSTSLASDGMAPAASSPPVMRPWPGLMPPAMAAEFCGIGRRTWDRLCAKGIAPESKILDGRKMWSRADLERWIEAGLPSREEAS